MSLENQDTRLKSNKIIIFGLRDYAEIAHYYLENHTEFEVVAFTVHREYYPDKNSFKGLPIIEFENIEKYYAPSQYSFFAPMSPKRMNTLREAVYKSIKQKGYTFINYIHENSVIASKEIGENCMILENNVIQPFSKIGNNVVIWSGNFIGHHSLIENHVTITTHTVISGNCRIGKNSFIGANSAIREFVRINEGTMVAMSACITKDTEAWSAYMGVPAQKVPNKRSLELI